MAKATISLILARDEIFARRLSDLGGVLLMLPPANEALVAVDAFQRHDDGDIRFPSRC